LKGWRNQPFASSADDGHLKVANQHFFRKGPIRENGLRTNHIADEKMPRRKDAKTKRGEMQSWNQSQG